MLQGRIPHREIESLDLGSQCEQLWLESIIAIKTDSIVSVQDLTLREHLVLVGNKGLFLEKGDLLLNFDCRGSSDSSYIHITVWRRDFSEMSLAKRLSQN